MLCLNMVVDLFRIAPQLISNLQKNEIFVFGSDLAGVHIYGHAKDALLFGAQMGKYSGHCGQTYAIPVRQKNQHYNFTLEEIEKHVNEFHRFAKRKKELVFYVTPIACHERAHKNEDIAPLFKDFLYLENVYLPLQWRKYLV